jgi:hypothetical protein
VSRCRVHTGPQPGDQSFAVEGLGKTLDLYWRQIINIYA